MMTTNPNYLRFWRKKLLKTVIITKGEGIVVTTNIDTSQLCPCNHEEADKRMLLHVQHAIENGCKEVTICCTDTDVVV